jgi:dipeptidyl aminopeptidase/acylaminoacyl peptidase
MRALGFICVVLAAVVATLTCSEAATADIFPVRLATPETTAAKRGWRLEDIVEVTRVDAIALQYNGKQQAAFILKQPSLHLDDDRYALYALDLGKPGAVPVKLAESSFLADLQARPGSDRWTVRAEFGHGVQLYEIGGDGQHSLLLASPDIARVGGSDGLITNTSVGGRRVGILAYGWAPDGSKLWYLRLRLPDAAEQKAFRNGIRWDPNRMQQADSFGPQAAKAIELHLYEPRAKRDRLVTAEPGDRNHIHAMFGPGEAIGWIGDAKLYYRSADRALWTYVLASGRRERALPPDSPHLVGGVIDRTSATARGFLVGTREDGGKYRLVEKATDGTVLRDFGEVPFLLNGSSRPARFGDVSIHEVRLPAHQGLIRVSASGIETLVQANDDLGGCDFDTGRLYGICVRQSVTRAPEIVRVSLENGAVEPLVRVNARYDAIEPLHVSYQRWTNRFGVASDGYVTLPRGYVAGASYPAVVVTHGTDARNDFVSEAFQWSFPLQAWAERGYVVLSVNEKNVDTEALRSYGSAASAIPLDRMRQAMIASPVATMEAAVQSAVESGLVDPARVAIAGYSRGGEMVTASLSQSKLFKAGINADDSWYSAAAYWTSDYTRGIYRSVFGGSPYDPAFLPGYLAYSPSYRASEFSGALLQFFSAMPTMRGQELDQALIEAGVPSEFVYFQDETHLLHRPGAKFASMQRALDWLDYWLRDRRDLSPDKAEQYRRWDAMREKWQAKKS